MNRREFIGSSALFAASGIGRAVSAETSPGGGRLVASAPMLQAPAETTMGVVWAVGTMAKGEVDTRPRYGIMPSIVQGERVFLS